jgi:hypothetical protein
MNLPDGFSIASESVMWRWHWSADTTKLLSAMRTWAGEQEAVSRGDRQYGYAH